MENRDRSKDRRPRAGRPGNRGTLRPSGRGGFRGRGMSRRPAPFVPRDTRSTQAGSERVRHALGEESRAETLLNDRALGNGDETRIPPLEAGNVRIIPLGGVEEIGRNMVAVEFGRDIVIIDCGLQFREEETPGIDYILPNTKYLEDNMERVRGLFITHGHLDHIGGIPYIIDKIGYPPIYTRRLTAMMIRKRQEEFPHLRPLDIKEIEKDDVVRVGDLKIRFFAVYHTIPDSMGVIIETPYGDIVDTGDLRLEHVDGIPTESEEREYAKFKDRNVLMLMQDST
ncbi:MAG: ribonuclease J, partial [Minisyncoccia bacterium]